MSNDRPQLTVTDLTETRISNQHMVFTAEGRKRLQMVLEERRLPWFRRVLRWLKRWSNRI